MSACPVCNRAFNRDQTCAVCHDGGPKVGDLVEWYQIKAGGAMVPASGVVLRIGVTDTGSEFFIVGSGKSGKGKEYMKTRKDLTHTHSVTKATA